MAGVALFDVVYGIAFLRAYRRAASEHGSADLGGTPRWRAALGVLPQIVSMPALLCARLALPAWASPTCDHCFVHVFASLLIFDLAVIELNHMLLLHHGVCLAGHAFAIGTAPEAFVYYHAGVVALEAGSGISSVWWLWGENAHWPTPLYQFGMSASNAIAGLAALGWSVAAASLPVVGRATPVLIIAALLYMRQLEMHNLTHYGRAMAST